MSLLTSTTPWFCDLPLDILAPYSQVTVSACLLISPVLISLSWRSNWPSVLPESCRLKLIRERRQNILILKAKHSIQELSIQPDCKGPWEPPTSLDHAQPQVKGSVLDSQCESSVQETLLWFKYLMGSFHLSNQVGILHCRMCFPFYIRKIPDILMLYLLFSNMAKCWPYYSLLQKKLLKMRKQHVSLLP